MASFSERNGYVESVKVLVREDFSIELADSICSCYDILAKDFSRDASFRQVYKNMELFLWISFLHKRRNDFFSGLYGECEEVITDYLKDENNKWYKKFDAIEKTLDYLHNRFFQNGNELTKPGKEIVNKFISNINHFFKDLNYGYRIVDWLIVPISSEMEIQAIQTAIDKSKDNIKTHLHTALELFSKRPSADYRNSIKESISAVEAFCREKTGKSTLGEALNVWKKDGMIIPRTLTLAFEKLYAYTNQPDAGIRHSLMDDDGTYTPGAEEAMFMMISCSAFLNYLYGKMAR